MSASLLGLLQQDGEQREKTSARIGIGLLDRARVEFDRLRWWGELLDLLRIARLLHCFPREMVPVIDVALVTQTCVVLLALRSARVPSFHNIFNEAVIRHHCFAAGVFGQQWNQQPREHHEQAPSS